MNFKRIRSKMIISIFIVSILISSGMILNAAGPSSIEHEKAIKESQVPASTSRARSINIKNFTDLSDGYFVVDKCVTNPLVDTLIASAHQN